MARRIGPGSRALQSWTRTLSAPSTPRILGSCLGHADVASEEGGVLLWASARHLLGVPRIADFIPGDRGCAHRIHLLLGSGSRLLHLRLVHGLRLYHPRPPITVGGNHQEDMPDPRVAWVRSI